MMDTPQIFKRTLKMTWRYRALWLFGFLLALTVSNVFWLALNDQDGGVVVGNRIILRDSTIIRFPGNGVTVDFRGSGFQEIEVEGVERGWYRDLSDQLGLGDISALYISLAVIVLLNYLIRVLFRHTSRAALIQMVDDYGCNEEMATLGRGFRLGWSKVAWKLFLIELCINLPVTIFFSLLFFVTMSPFFLFGLEGISNSTPIVIGILFLVVGGFLVNFFLLLAASLVLSVVKPVIRQACVVDGLGVFASISRGFKTSFGKFEDVLLTWFIVFIIRLIWTILVIPVFLIFIPVIIITVLLGLMLGAIVAALVALIAGLFMSTPFAWIIGGIAALPLFVKITFLPITFLSGIVQVIRLGFWTLSYREFRILPGVEVQQPDLLEQVDE